MREHYLSLQNPPKGGFCVCTPLPEHARVIVCANANPAGAGDPCVAGGGDASRLQVPIMNDRPRQALRILNCKAGAKSLVTWGFVYFVRDGRIELPLEDWKSPVLPLN